MRKLNLTNNDISEVKFKISKFPDGQQQVTILGYSKWAAVEKGESEVEVVLPLDDNTIRLSARLNNFSDLELIICTVASLRELNVKFIHLNVPYFLGSRSDRKFEKGSNNYLKTVICPIINSLNFESVTVFDPHSDVLEALLNNFKKVDNLSLVRFATNNYQYENKKKSGKMSEDFILISPDAGANKKIFKIAEQIGYKGDIITCSKSRDVDGKLTKVEIPISTQLIDKDMIIIDDICDGGATFLNIAKRLKKLYTGKIYLIVTHGIFSKGFKELNKYFDGIYCTNSYSDIAGDMYGEITNVKQLNAF